MKVCEAGGQGLWGRRPCPKALLGVELGWFWLAGEGVAESQTRTDGSAQLSPLCSGGGHVYCDMPRLQVLMPALPLTLGLPVSASASDV